MKTARNAIRLLREFTTDTPKIGVSELSRRLRLDRATVHRMLRTLLEERFIEQEADTRVYRLGPGVLELAQSFLKQNGIADIAMPHLYQLRDQTGETVALQILDGAETVCVAMAESRHPVRVTYYLGERMPVYCTSSGFVFLAGMSPSARKAILAKKLQKRTSRTVVDTAKLEEIIQDVVRKGVSFADETYIAGARAISAPIRGPGQDVVAVVTMVAPSQRISLKQLSPLGRPLKAAAAAISADIARVGTIGTVLRPGQIAS